MEQGARGGVGRGQRLAGGSAKAVRDAHVGSGKILMMVSPNSSLLSGQNGRAGSARTGGSPRPTCKCQRVRVSLCVSVRVCMSVRVRVCVCVCVLRHVVRVE